METTLTIQQVAEEMGLSIDTLRYYERIGLLELEERQRVLEQRMRQHADRDAAAHPGDASARRNGEPTTSICPRDATINARPG
ncbi:MAG TPA: MerR family DNA-binding transcriptional regulator [Ktedonobacterales bacterium]